MGTEEFRAHSIDLILISLMTFAAHRAGSAGAAARAGASAAFAFAYFRNNDSDKDDCNDGSDDECRPVH